MVWQSTVVLEVFYSLLLAHSCSAFPDSTVSTWNSIYVTPNNSTACRDNQDPCFTLNEYASSQYEHFLNNTIVHLFSGVHYLNTSLKFESLQNLSFRGVPTDSIVLCDEGVNISCQNCMDVEILSVKFTPRGTSTGCGFAFYNSSIIQLRNVTITGHSIAGFHSSILSIQSYIKITDTRFIGISGSALMSFESLLNFTGNNSFIDNSAHHGGALMIVNTKVQFSGSIYFMNNSAKEGGSMYLSGTTKLCLSPPFQAYFIENHASSKGGAIFFDDSASSIVSKQCPVDSLPGECFISFNNFSYVNDLSLVFVNNSAGKAGTILYGGQLDKCKMVVDCSNELDICGQRSKQHHVDNAIEVFQNISTIDSGQSSVSTISSKPHQICRCKESMPDCTWRTPLRISVHPGQQFSLTVTAVSQAGHPVPSRILSKNVNSDSSYLLSPAIQSINDLCTSISFQLYAPENCFQQYKVYHDGPCQSSIPVIELEVTTVPCPIGFNLSLNSQNSQGCVCSEQLQTLTSNCYIDSKSFERKSNSFFVSQQDNISTLILHYRSCPFDFCKIEPINVSLSEPSVQCDFNRTGVLCGQCKSYGNVSYSLALGSLHCRSCSNRKLALIVPFVLAGVCLVAFLFLFRLTVDVGTLNGLIFYANVVQADYQEFFPRSTRNFFTIFIAWLNLDLGIETCFFDGMNIYHYSWLQFLFPFYVYILIGCIIVACHYSRSISRLFGQNPVAVLATLVLLSYSKITKALIAPLSYTHLTYFSSQNESKTVLVWLYDGDVQYFRGYRHIILGLFVVIIAVIVLLPYTFLLLFGHWLYKYSDRKVFSWLNKLKPFLDAYYAPFRRQSRYWIGILLLARGGLFLTFIFNATDDDNDNILVVASVSAALTLMKGRVYEKHYNDILETFFTLNLCIFSVATFYLTGESDLSKRLRQQDVLSKVSVAAVFIIFVGILTFHAYLQLKLTDFVKNRITPYIYRLFKHKLFNTFSTENENQNEAEGNRFDMSIVHLRESLLESVNL